MFLSSAGICAQCPCQNCQRRCGLRWQMNMKGISSFQPPCLLWREYTLSSGASPPAVSSVNIKLAPRLEFDKRLCMSAYDVNPRWIYLLYQCHHGVNKGDYLSMSKRDTSQRQHPPELFHDLLLCIYFDRLGVLM